MNLIMLLLLEILTLKHGQKSTFLHIELKNVQDPYNGQKIKCSNSRDRCGQLFCECFGDIFCTMDLSMRGVRSAGVVSDSKKFFALAPRFARRSRVLVS